ncbi:DNA methyltransferase [Lactococcus lactis]|uniref:DNA methyltransferase n=1 Tax=Lactococcus lactis TaxID=1358 RepID=UPI003F235376
MKKVVWALFDSGNGCYKQAVKKYYGDDVKIISIGIDIENKNTDFLNLDLSDTSEYFGESNLFKELDNLPKPDIILASPPCESWSNASAMLNGNVCWYTESTDTMFGQEFVSNEFTIRTRQQLETKNDTPFKKHWWKTVYSRLNGELCAFNTIRIIERYQPEVWVIENPQSSRIWKYYKQIQDFQGIKNIAHYSAYDSERYSKKPTCFYSNLMFNLKTTDEQSKLTFRGLGDKGISRSYNIRSEIPLQLIKDILDQCFLKLEKIA